MALPGDDEDMDDSIALVRHLAPDPSIWNEIIGDAVHRSYMFLRHKSPNVTIQDMEHLMEMVEWRPLINAAGAVSRKTAWYVTPPCCCPYGYGNNIVMPQSMPPWFLQMSRRWLHEALGDHTSMPDSANLNLYEHGGHSVHWHADDERLFDGRNSDCRIISVSLGADRLFKAALSLGRSRDGLLTPYPWRVAVQLTHGDICTMEGLFQKHYIHKVSRCVRQQVTPRINVTFRYLVHHVQSCPLGSSS